LATERDSAISENSCLAMERDSAISENSRVQIHFL